MPWSDRAAAEGQLHATNALVDSTEAHQTARRLDLPGRAPSAGKLRVVSADLPTVVVDSVVACVDIS